MNPLDICIQVFGGLSIFLLGMKYMSEGIQTTAGKRLRSMISAVTDNRIMACFIGTAVTAVIQSSSITTVMLVGLVNAGVMSLAQAFGVILGANIGTTITGWIVSLNVLDWGLPVMAAAICCYLFGKSDKFKFISLVIVGVGMVFFGLNLMKQGIEPLKNSELITSWFEGLDPGSPAGLLKCIFIGAAVTAIIQSSSATVAITITLAQTGVLEFPAAAALVLGENIGTTVTALLASIGATTGAKRVAWAHILSKAIGVVLLALVFPFYLDFLASVRNMLNINDIAHVAQSIALAHTFFNIFLVVLFLAIAKYFTALVCRLIPGNDTGDMPHITYLDVRMLGTPAFGIQQSQQEVIRMADKTQTMFNDLRACLIDENNKEAEKAIFTAEEALDEHQKEVVEFLAKLIRGNISMEIAGETRRQIRLADEYESVSDYIEGILKLILRARQKGLTFSEKARSEFLDLHDKVALHLSTITHSIRKGTDSDFMISVHAENNSIKHLFKDFRQEHMNRIQSGSCDVLAAIIYSDIMQSYRKIEEHALNIAEAIAGEK